MEIFYNGSWGTVCDDYWDMNDARVVCRQLGFPDAVSAPRSAHFGNGSGQVWLDDVGCSGSESTIENCPHAGWGVKDCSLNEEASVICSSELYQSCCQTVFLKIQFSLKSILLLEVRYVLFKRLAGVYCQLRRSKKIVSTIWN